MDSCINVAVDTIETVIRVFVLKDFASALISGVRVAVNGVTCINSKKFATKRRELESMRFFRKLDRTGSFFE